MPSKYKLFFFSSQKIEVNGCKMKTSCGALHTSGRNTDKEGLPREREKHRGTAWSAQGKKGRELYLQVVPWSYLRVLLSYPCTPPSQLRLVNWSSPKINIPPDGGHCLPEIASVRVWVPASRAPRGRLCHFIRVIASGRVSAPGTEALLSEFLFSPSSLEVWHLISSVNYISQSEDHPIGLIFQNHRMKELHWQTM